MNLNRANIIKTVNTPLGFFALSLLTGEVFLGIVLIYSNLEEPHKYIGMWLGAGMFALVVVIVALFVWRLPENLIFGEQGHLRNKENFGTGEKNMSKNELERLVRVKPEQEPELKKSL